MRTIWLGVALIVAASGSVCRADDNTDVKKDDGKDYVVAIDATDAAACSPAAAKKSGLIYAAPAKCHIGRGAECCERLWAWLTYCPLKKSCLCDCCHKCHDCRNPPLYTYFLDPYHACASGAGCATCEK